VWPSLESDECETFAVTELDEARAIIAEDNEFARLQVLVKEGTVSVREFAFAR
jgi:hypothetical protein